MFKIIISILVFTVIFNTLLSSSNYVPDLSSIDFSRFISRYTSYSGSIKAHNGRLYVDSNYAFEEYHAGIDGELTLNEFYTKNYNTIPGPVIYEDIIYYTYYTKFPGSYDNDIILRSIDTSSPSMEILDEIQITSDHVSFKLGVNENYLFHTSTENVYTDVYDRENLELVGSLLTGGYWAIKDHILYMQMMTADSSAVLVKDISDINHPVEKTWIKTQDTEYNHNYVFDENLLFVLKNSKVLIIDTVDEDNINLITIIDDIPQMPNLSHFMDCQRYMDFLLIANNYGSIWIYDIEDIENPQLVNVVHNNDGGEFNFDTMALLGDYIYMSQLNTGIRKFPVTELPQINFDSEEYGNSGFMIRAMTFVDPYIFFLNRSKELLYFDVRDEDAIVTELFSAVEDGHLSEVAANDSLLFVRHYIPENINRESRTSIEIFNYDDTGIFHVNSVVINNYDILKLYFQEPHLIATTGSPRHLIIYTMLDDYDLQEEYIVNYGSNIVIPQPNDVFCNYLFISLANSLATQFWIDVYQLLPEIEFLETINLQSVGPYRSIDIIDSDCIFLQRFHQSTTSTYYAGLGHYSLFNEIQIYDSITVEGNLGAASYSNNQRIISCSENYGGVASLYKIFTEGFQYIGQYDFGPMAYQFVFLPELNKLYSKGFYSIVEYSLDYESSVEEGVAEKPIVTYLSRNYPNPFNPETTISFYLEREKRVKLEIFNIRGQKLTTLIDEILPEGDHSLVWSPETYRGRNLPSGVYLYRLKAGDYDKTRKMLYLK